MRSLLALVCLATAVACVGVATAYAAAAGKTGQPQNSYDGPPMAFTIVRSAASECEPNCPQWISAEGIITRETPQLFRKTLKQAGKARLPVLINSPGGDIEAAIAMGEIIRARKLDVGVAWTLLTDCWPSDAICLLHSQKQGIFHGTPVTWRAYCVSACSFVLAGGRARLAGGATLGIVEVSTTVKRERVFYEERYRLVNGKKKVISRKITRREPMKSYTTNKLDKATQRKFSLYARKMGLGRGFLAFFTTPRSAPVYYPTSKEALAAGLLTALDSARSLVDNGLCLAIPAAENCVKLVAAAEQAP